MKISAVTTCVHYDDYLALSLPSILPHVDELVVVTATCDNRTPSVCDSLGCRYVRCDACRSPDERLDGKFNKGVAVNAGLNSLRDRQWVILFDADIVFPDNFRGIVESLSLDTTALYGAKRTGEDEFVAMKPGRKPIAIGSGYFQLYYDPAEKQQYSVAYNNVERSDYEFRKKFDKVIELPILLLHLGTPMEDWNGRKSERHEPRSV